MKTKDLTINALIAAIYVALTLAFEPLSFGPLQVRISEILMLLILVDKKFAFGVVIGCFIANLYSPFIYDAIIGTSATALAAFLMTKTENKYLGLLLPAIVNGPIIGAQLYFFADLPFFLSSIQVFLGEIIAVFVPGILFLDRLRHVLRNL
ncbi:QueT transporter family protein [Erysipelothrix urinaevulpis]|uniref:QueT transporter family protein n=1 Tax=Erysipelothrix urinaevulpis TaxID=2683717 RepID=UPI00135BD25D|nr:QueT transporter family protein [Erysipelothrix urinaevulpis]